MKCAALSLLLVSLSFTSFSQLLIKGRAGLNLSRMQREAASFRTTGDKQVFKSGPNAGVACEYLLKNGFSVQAELNYSLKGLKDKSEVVRNNGTYYGYGYNFHYAELPVLLRYAATEKFRVGVGPSLAYLFRVEEAVEGIDITDPRRKYKKLDIGLNADAAYLLNRFEIGARYTHGIKMVKFKGDEDYEIVGSEREYQQMGKNRTLQVYVAYKFKG